MVFFYNTNGMFALALKNTGVVGCGWFGAAHCRNYMEISNLVAVCDINEEQARKIGEKYGVNWYTDHKAMIKNEDLDSVSIVISPSHISSVGYDFIEAGINVLLEKPLGVKLKDLEKLKMLDQSVRIMPGFIEIFNPIVEQLKENLVCIGSPIMAVTRRIGRFPRRFWRIGVVLDLAFHDIYVLRYLFGEVEELRSMLSYINNQEFEDAAVLLLELEDGVSGVIEANWLTPIKERRLRVYGSGGTIEIDFVSQRLNIFKDDPMSSPRVVKEEILHPHFLGEPLRRELETFLYSKNLPFTLRDGIKVLQLALEASKKPSISL